MKNGSKELPIKRSRGYLWFFGVLLALAVLATVVLIVFNLRQQLKPEQLAAARAQWEAKGPRDYTMTYTIKRNEIESLDYYHVRVRGGKAVEAKFNDVFEEPGLLAYRGMHRLLDEIEGFQKIDAEKGAPKTYVRAIFDEQTGAVRWYVRRVMGTRQRVEITVEAFEVK